MSIRPIVFRCPVASEPSGGVRRLHRHVRWLQQEGINVTLDSFSPGKPATGPSDALLAVPEGDPLGLASALRKVVVAQSLRMPAGPVGVIVAVQAASSAVSSRIREALGMEAVIIHPSVDPLLFAPGEKLARIAYMPRRNGDMARRVVSRCLRNGWDAEAIDRLPLEGVADSLRGAAVFLSASLGEGFGLPMLEAMASGCITVGFPAVGGLDFLDDGRNAMTAPDGREEVLAGRLREAMDLWESGGQESLVQEARRTALHFSPERERSEVVGFWSDVLRRVA